MNAEWHARNKMPERATVDQRILWHTAHAEHCACRSIPRNVAEEIHTRGRGGRPPREQGFEPIRASIEGEHAEWKRLLAGAPSGGGQGRTETWSALETLVHVTSWKENALRIARDQARRRAPRIEGARGPAGVLHIDVDRFNHEVQAAHRGWTRKQVVEWSERVHRDPLSALAALPRDRLIGGRGRHGAFMWYWMPALIHSAGHRREAEVRIKAGAPTFRRRGER